MENNNYSTEFNFNDIFEGKVLDVYDNNKCLVYVYKFFMSDSSDKKSIIGKYNSVNSINGVICKPIVLSNIMRPMEIGDSVLMFFLNGNPQYPYYLDASLGKEKVNIIENNNEIEDTQVPTIVSNEKCDGIITEEQLKYILDELEKLKNVSSSVENENTNNEVIEGLISDAINTINSVSSSTTIKDIIIDGIFSSSEKKSIAKDYNIILEESKIINILSPLYYDDANELEIINEKYMESHIALTDFINPMITNINDDTEIIKDEFYNKFNEYYTNRQEVLNNIHNISKIKLLEYSSITRSTLDSLDKEKLLIEGICALYKINTFKLNDSFNKIELPKTNLLEYITERISVMERILSVSKSYVDSLMNDVKIGSNNLVLNSNFKFKEKHWNFDTDMNRTIAIVEDELYDSILKTNILSMNATLSVDSYKLNITDDLILSLWIKCNSNMSISFQLKDSSNKPITIPYTSKLSKDDLYKKIVVPMTIIKEVERKAGLENRPRLYIEVLNLDTKNSLIYELGHIKLEIGNVLTEWSACREDLLEELEDFKDSVSQYTSSITQTVDKIQLSVDGFQSTTEQITDKVNGMTYTMEEFREQTSQLTLLLDGITMNVKDLYSKTEQLKGELDGFATTDSVEIIKKNFAQLELTMKGLEVSVEQYESKITELKKEVDGKADNSKITEIESTIVDWQATVDQLGGSISNVNTNITEITNNINEITDVLLVDISTDILTMKGTMDGIEQSISSTNSSLEKLTKEVDGKVNVSEFETLTEEYAGIKTELGNVNTTVSKHTEELKTVSGNLNDLQIGGRNLFRATTNIVIVKNDPILERKTEDAINGFKVTGCAGLTDSAIRIANIISKNDKYTLSGYVKATGVDKISIKFCKQTVGTIETSLDWKFFKFTKDVTNQDPNTNNFIDIEDLASFTYFFNDVKFEVGDKATDWSPAPEDVNDAINNTIIITDKKITDAKSEIDVKLETIKLSVSETNEEVLKISSVATGAREEAKEAQATADKAKLEATNATNKLNDISSDSKLTPNEKIITKKEIDIINGEKDKIVHQALAFELSSVDYKGKYDTLISYIKPLLYDLESTSDISGMTFRLNFTNYYNSRQDLLNAISDKSKSVADKASADATTAINNAKLANDAAILAQNKADESKIEADKAIKNIQDMSSDSKATPTEKIQLDLKGQEIIKEQPSIINQANVFNISTVTYASKYTALHDYLYGTNGLLKDKTVTTDIIRKTFDLKFTEYYTERQNVLDKVAQKSKAASDKALEDAKIYTDGLESSVNIKFTEVRSDIQLNKDSILLKVEQTDIDKSIKANNTEIDTKISNVKSEIDVELEKISLRVSGTEETTTEIIEKVDETVKTVKTYYAISNSATTAPTTGWAIEPPQWVDGKYIWSKVTTTYTNGNSSTSDPVCITGGKGSQGVPGTPAITYYTWVKYADSPTSGMSDLPDGKEYIGLAYNKTTPTESTNYGDYTWSLIKGDTGEPGVPGTDGKTYYTWVKYADSPTSGISDSPDGKKYMGLAYNKLSPNESNLYSDYTWSLIKGDKGDTGVKGPTGPNGITYYTWVKYADSPTSGMSDSPDGKRYMGLAYNKTTAVESNVYSEYTWSLIKGDTGEPGIQGPTGSNGITYYTWIKYADSPTSGMTDYPDDKEYIGIAYNKTTAVESTKYEDYTWSLIKGDKGDTGVQGPSGITYYTWIKYADSPTSGMTDSPEGKKYMGLAYNKLTATESINYSDYTWSLIKGDKGDTGVKGPTGPNGITYYTWIKYADSPTTGISDSPTGKKYMGLAYNKTTPNESNLYGDYTWSLIKGDKGDTGVKGPTGANGITYYTWIKYADSPTSGMTDIPDGKNYIGLAYNKLTSVESDNYNEYTWSLIKGEPGVQGPSGKTYYTWVKYADSPTTGMSDTPDGKKYMGLAYNKLTATEGTNYSDYTWSLIKGDKGDTGVKGPTGPNGITYYTWVKYADSPTSGMSDNPTGKKYMGLAYNKTTPTESTLYTEYTWSLIKGDKGDTGVQGPNGITYYTWIKYADTPTTGMSDYPDGKKYMGLAYNKETDVESTDYSDYTWSLIKGDKGDTGVKGPAGANGITYYTWVKYADTPTTGMSDLPDGKKYMGLAYNKLTATESNLYTEYTWSLIKGDKGDTGVKGPTGANGITYYTWIKYADTPTSGMSDTADNKKYMGLAYNKTTANESTNYSDYTWSLIKGDKGDTGVKGPTGANGVTYYTWIKYADTPTTGMNDSPTGKKYLGLAYNKTTATESTVYSDYTWSLIKGDKGEAGVQGPTGPNGITYYTWIKYADSPTTGMTDNPDGKKYMGLAYNKTTATESINYSDYTWSLIKGDKGDTGVKGPTGPNGITYYTWIKYADSPTSGISDSPTGKKYMGLAYNKTTANESNTYTDYTWSLIKGDKGDTGIQGPSGTDGKTYYTWIKYADSPTSGMSDYPDGKKYMGLAYNKTTANESTSYAEYTWSLIKGDKGDTGVKGPTGANGVTYYTWIKYADTPTTGMTDTPAGKKYLGLAYNKTTPNESNTYSDYTWSLIKGDKGDTGVKGPTGANGVTYYTWIKYADTPTTGMSDSPNGKKYLGLAYNKTTATESTVYGDYTWSLIKGDKGDTGVPGTDGKTYYTWVKYADSPTSGISDSPDGKKYMGLAYNKTTAAESNNYTDYTWSLIKGDKGDTGVKGPTGSNGITYYTWIKYADTPTTGMSDSPTGKKYMGLAHNKTTATESNVYTDYAWALIKGDKGDTGVQGTPGVNGKTYYTWVKYADSPTSGMTDTPDGKKYMGLAYNKTVITESTNYADYTWSLIKGDKGDTGVKGPTGANGVTYYTWVKYADSPTSGMSDLPTNKKYLGLAYNKTTATESNVYSDYTWSLIKGDTGASGSNGVSITKVDVEYYLSTSATALSGGAWSTTAPAWVNGKYMWSRTKTTYSSGNPTYSTAACITGSKGPSGTNGTNGTNGATGPTGTGITSITEEYAISTSKTTAPTTGWTTTPPTWSTGKYIWTRSKIVYKNPTSTAYTTPICDSSWDAATEVDKKVTTTNTKVSEIATNLSNITQRVSNTETKVTEVNGKITNHETRIKAAESKITDSAIINTVKNSTTDGKRTFAQMSDVTQTATDITFKFSQSGGANLLKNGGFKRTDRYGWFDIEHAAGGTDKAREVWSNRSYAPSGKHVLVLRATNSAGEYGIQQNVNVKSHTQYTLSFYVSQHRCPRVGCVIRNSNSTWLTSTNYNDIPMAQDNQTGQGYAKKIITFNSGSNITIGIELTIYDSDDNGHAWFYDIMLNEGTTALPWSAHPSEVYDGNTVIDGDGVTVNNGALRVKDGSGNMMLEGNSSGNLYLRKSLNVGSALSVTQNGLHVASGKLVIASNLNSSYNHSIKLNDNAIIFEQHSTINGMPPFSSVISHNSNAQLVFNSNGGGFVFEGGAKGSSVSIGGHLTSNSLSTGTLRVTSNGQSDNILVGDDAYLGDCNEAHTIKLRSSTNAGYGYIKFGNGAKMGYAGGSSLDIHGDTYITGGLTAVNCYIHSTSGTNGFQAGNGDNATWETCNLDIRAWWGLGIKDYSNTRRILFDARSGGMHAKGSITAEGKVISRTEIDVYGGGIWQGNQRACMYLYTAGYAPGVGLDWEGYFRPYGDASIACGHPGWRFSTCYAQNGVSTGSDAKWKKDIKYINKNSKTLSSEASSHDYYNFIKNEFKPTTYSYIDTLAAQRTTTLTDDGKVYKEDNSEYLKGIGFIAQDLLGTKVGEMLIEKPSRRLMEVDSKTGKEIWIEAEDQGLTYNISNYISIVAIALQEATKKIDTLEKENLELKDRISLIEAKLGI